MKYLVSLVVLAACGFDPPGAGGGDDAPPTPTVGFASASSSTDEGATAVEVFVTLSAVSTAEVSVAYASAGGSATDGADYTLTPGTLTFAPGEMQQSFSLAIVADTMEEAEETIELALSGATGATLGTAGHTITIANDTLPRVQFASASSNVDEGTTGSLELVLDKAAPVEVSVKVQVTGGTATAGGDYTFQNDVIVTFPAGSMSQTVPLEAVQDALDEDLETVALQLVEPSPGVLPGVNFVQDVNLVDDDAPPTASFLIDASAFGEAGTYGMIVRLSAASGRTVTVPYQVIPGAANAATPTTDYVLEASPLVFQPGDIEETILIQAVADTEAEQNETVDVELVAPADGTATLGAITRRTHTILDDDSAFVRFVNASGTADELDIDRDYNITVALSRPLGDNVTVDLVFDAGNSSASAADFDMPSSVTIFAGTTSRQFTFRVTGDNMEEDDEVVILRLANPTGGAALGTPSVRSVTIADDD